MKKHGIIFGLLAIWLLVGLLTAQGCTSSSSSSSSDTFEIVGGVQ